MGNCLETTTSNSNNNRTTIGSSKRAEDKYKVSSITSNSQDKSSAISTKPKLNPKDFMFIKQSNAVLKKESGSISGKADFIIEDCDNCIISLKDHLVQITIDNCDKCTVFIGVCEGSCFIRNCKNSTFIVSCSQFRMRDCEKCRVWLACGSQPVIETSSDIQFDCYNGSYQELDQNLRDAKLNIWNNEWWNVHDFTESSNSARPNYKISPSSNVVPEAACKTLAEECNICFERSKSGWPCTVGTIGNPKFKLFVFGNVNSNSLALRDYFNQQQQQVKLIQTKAVYFDILSQVKSVSSAFTVDILNKMKSTNEYAVAIQLQLTDSNSDLFIEKLKIFTQKHNILMYHSESSEVSTKESSILFKQSKE